MDPLKHVLSLYERGGLTATSLASVLVDLVDEQHPAQILSQPPAEVLDRIRRLADGYRPGEVICINSADPGPERIASIRRWFQTQDKR